MGHGLVHSIAPFIQTTLSLIFACVIGVSTGAGIEFHRGVMVMPAPTPTAAFAVGGFIFSPTTEYESLLDHEYGHLEQETFLGGLYLVVVGIPSMLSVATNPRAHNRMWFERWATELGSGIR